MAKYRVCYRRYKSRAKYACETLRLPGVTDPGGRQASADVALAASKLLGAGYDVKLKNGVRFLTGRLQGLPAITKLPRLTARRK